MEKEHAYLRLELARRFAAASLLALVVLAYVVASPNGAPAHDGCNESSLFQPVTIAVPANGIVVFGINDLLGASGHLETCHGALDFDAVITNARASSGEVRIRRGLTESTWGARPGSFGIRFQFAPERGFRGVSHGWEFAIVGRSEAHEEVTLGTIAVTFEVRNSPPVAVDDALTLTANVDSVVVPGQQGVLVNDTDANGDRLIVHADGVTRFAWGSVEIARDGSYRVTVTDHEVTGTHQVRYLIWDQEGSTASADYGLLSITFAEPAEGPASSLSEPSGRILTAPSAPGQP
jgi:hypothetical protein